MFILHLPDKETAMLILYYAKQGAEAHKGSFIEAPKIAKITTELIKSIHGHSECNEHPII